ncbi:MAG: hypothetical protein OQL08_05520 [Gammaproteobacteria bacterium]|nr:hypothetical protein [Gammaproteobacteria bacterium]
MTRVPERHREAQQRSLLAQAAARLMAQSGLRDFAAAKRKAAAQLGLHPSRNLPGNEEIEAALHDYQRLFQHEPQRQQLHQLRQTALQAMRLLTPFSPRLVGAVLNGTADRHCPIQLHLFADTSEEVGIFLLEHRIPCEQGEQRIHYARGNEEQRPLLRFIAGESTLELTLFAHRERRHSPLSQVNGRPMQRADSEQLQRLLATDEG